MFMLCCKQKISERYLEQQINVKFCLKIGKCASEMLPLLKMANSKHAMKNSSVIEWTKQFKERLDVHNGTRSGQSETQRTGAKVDRVLNVVH